MYTHAGLAGDAAARLADEAGLTEDDRAVVVLAALLHDAGKVTHTRHRLMDDGTVKITSHGHDTAGVALARDFLRQIGAPRRLTGRIAPLIKEHMVTASTAHPSSAAVRRLARRLAPATLAEWAIVVEADKGGRGAASRTGETEPWMAKAATLGVTHGPQRQILSGAHLIAAGMTPGPEFGDVLKAASRAQDDGAFEDEAGALAWLAELNRR
ncbi:HD domain-containing protein [Cellulomonas soli]